MISRWPHLLKRTSHFRSFLNRCFLSYFTSIKNVFAKVLLNGLRLPTIMDNGFDPLLLWGRGCLPVGVFEVDLDLDAVEAVLFGRQSSLSSSSSSASASDEGGNYDSSVVVDDGDNLVPSFDASERKLSVMASTFSLVASSFGAGGAIFLPLAFEKFGTINIVPSFLSMIIIAYLTDRSLYLLCLCARRSGVASHGEVARVAFGRTMEKAVFALVFVFLLFILTFNFVIIRDVWTSIVQTVYNVDGKLVLLVCLTIVIPFSIQRRLYALRKCCYFGFATIMAFSVLLWYLGYAFPNNIATNTKGTIFLLSSRLLQESGSYLSVIPIFVMSFHSTFNILQTQAELRSPTNDRIQSVISRGVTIVFFINFAVGFAGGVILRKNRKTNGGNPGNLNLNIPQEQEQNASLISTIAWLCYGTAVLAALPVILVSARYNCLELINRICLEGREDGNCQRCRDICPEECCDDEEDRKCVYSNSIRLHGTIQLFRCHICFFLFSSIVLWNHCCPANLLFPLNGYTSW